MQAAGALDHTYRSELLRSLSLPAGGQVEFLKQDVADMIWKARLRRGVHAYHERYTQRISRLVKTLNIVLSAFLLFLVFSDLTPLSTSIPWFADLTFSKLLIGIFSLVLFIANVLMEVFAVNSRWLEHRLAITNYSDLLAQFAKAYSVDQSAQVPRKTLDLLKQLYTQLTMSDPALTDQQFQAGEISYRRFLRDNLPKRRIRLGGFGRLERLPKRKSKTGKSCKKWTGSGRWGKDYIIKPKQPESFRPSKVSLIVASSSSLEPCGRHSGFPGMRR